MSGVLHPEPLVLLLLAHAAIFGHTLGTGENVGIVFFGILIHWVLILLAIGELL